MSTSSERTAIVTGASSGIGRATAEALVRAGYTVFGTSRKATDTPTQVTMLVCDVTDDDAVSALVSTVLARTGRSTFWSIMLALACWVARKSSRSRRCRHCSTSTCSA